MSAAHPFAGFNPKPSAWGYNWTIDQPAKPIPVAQVNHCPSPEPSSPMPDQYANMPAALLNTLKRDKKPFTYTPGGVNLSEVLNARLQKRMERKKKYSEEKEAEPPKQVIVMPTYNTPLDMYSMQNALEALEVQAELVAANKSLSRPSRSATLPRNHTFNFQNDMDPGKGVSQSKAFRVLQIITDTEEDESDKPRGHHRDEMRFTGIRENKADIPSKFFHTLQKITGTDETGEEEQEQQYQEQQQQQYQQQQQQQYQQQQQQHQYQQQYQYQQQQQQKQQQRNEAVARQFEKQQPVSRPPFLAHPAQVDSGPPPAQPKSAPPALKRPAAFLPIKTSPQFRPVQPPCISNGPLRRNPSGGTNF